jgi:hypothetical protein
MQIGWIGSCRLIVYVVLWLRQASAIQAGKPGADDGGLHEMILLGPACLNWRAATMLMQKAIRGLAKAPRTA